MNLSTPSSAQAEQAVLASILMDPNYGMRCCIEAGIESSTFYYPGHAIVWETMLEFWNENEPIDLLTINGYMTAKGTLKAAGGNINGSPTSGAAFLAALQTLIWSGGSSTLSHHIEQIKQLAARRVMCLTFKRLHGLAMDQSEDFEEMFAAVQKGVLDVLKFHEGRKTHRRTTKELALRAMKRIDDALNGDGKIKMPYGIHELDQLTLGLRAPELTVIPASPSEGKTALSINFAVNLSVNCGLRVGYMSMDTSDDTLTDRFLAIISGVNIRKVKKERYVSDEDFKMIADAATAYANADILIRDDGHLTAAEMEATFSSWKADKGLDIGIIDHAQLAKAAGKTNGRTEEVEEFSRALKPMAKRLDIPLIVLSQITISDKGKAMTKNSSALIEDADNIIRIIHNEDGTSFLSLRKQKEGELGDVPVIFTRHNLRFTGVPKEEHAEQTEMMPQTKKAKSK